MKQADLQQRHVTDNHHEGDRAGNNAVMDARDREIELMQREQELLCRELDLTRRELELLRAGNASPILTQAPY